MGLTAEQEQQLRRRKTELHQSGKAIEAMKIGLALEAGEMPDDLNLLSDGGVRTDFPVHSGTNLTPPPRKGPGSAKADWIKFAAVVSDMDGEMLARMSRDDIIATLEAKGNLPADD
jgi:hypothetical protein